MGASQDEERPFLVTDEPHDLILKHRPVFAAKSSIIQSLILFSYVVAVSFFAFRRSPPQSCTPDCLHGDEFELYSQ